METPEITKTYESRESRLELISTLCEHYNDKIAPIIRNYLQISNITFKEDDLYNDDLQRKTLLELNSELSKISGKMSSLLNENKQLISSIGSIYGQINSVEDKLKEAPDRRYSRENLIEKFKGKENIPAGRFDYEETAKSLIELNAMFRGLTVAVELLK